MIQPERIQTLNNRDIRPGKYVLYWMQQSQRAKCNHALEYAIREADELKLPVVVAFGITQRYPGANMRHYAFMLEGLKDTGDTLKTRGIRLVVRLQPPRDVAVALSKDAALLVTDRGYLRFQETWRSHVAAKARCRVVQVEADVVVPVQLVSNKQEYAARTIRPRIHKRLKKFLRPLNDSTPGRDSLALRFSNTLDIDDTDSVLERLRVDRSVDRVKTYRGGTSVARRLLREFTTRKLDNYAEGRNEPGEDYISHMSPYLHFGQISPLYIALEAQKAKDVDAKSREAYIEELIVRRELSMNYCFYNPRYDSFDGLPDWAKLTLQQHMRDKREYEYTLADFENARTHDPYWNAAQKEMVVSGKMHNYMRMYWGKKILEWCADPAEAFQIALHLNNKYELDGRDPNSFTGVAWCFGRHDRPWRERPIFGTVRYMSSSGLERKFDMDAYMEKVEQLDDERT